MCTGRGQLREQPLGRRLERQLELISHVADADDTLHRRPFRRHARIREPADDELDDHALLELVRALDEIEVSRILDEMPPEHAADVVEELPTEEAEKILELMQEEKSEEVQEILEYPEHSAGRLMSPDFVAVNEGSTVEQAIEHIRKSVSEERAFEVYVVDSHRHLVGVVPLRRLLTAHPSSPVFAIRDDLTERGINEATCISGIQLIQRRDVAGLMDDYDQVWHW